MNDQHQTPFSMISSIEGLAMFTLDESGNVSTWNNGAKNMIGYTDAEIIGKNFSVFFKEVDRAKKEPEKILEQLRATELSAREGWRVKQDGTLFFADITVTKIFDDNKALKGFFTIVRDITKKQQQKDFSDRNLYSLINNTIDTMWSVDRDYKLITGNRCFNELVKMLSGSYIDAGASALGVGFTPDQLTRFKGYYDKAFAGETFTEIEHTTEPFENWAEISFHPIWKDGEVVGTACHGHDITKRVFAERKIIHLNRLYSLVSHINKTIVHARTDNELFDDICRIAVEFGKFKAAWIGMVDPSIKKLNLVAQCGMPSEDTFWFTDLTYETNGPQDVVITTGNYFVSNDAENDPLLDRWKPYTRSRQLGSCITFPICRSNTIVATFNLCTKEIGFFNDEEIALLKEATDDISFALDVLEKERLRILIEEKLRQSESQLRQSQKIAHLGSCELNFATGVVIWSEEHCRIFGVQPNENIQTQESWLSFIHPDDLNLVIKTVNEGKAAGKSFSFYHRIMRRDGVVRFVHSYNYFEFDNTGDISHLYGAIHDVTEVKLAEQKLKYNEQRLTQAQEIAHFGSWELSFITGAVVWSDEACRIYGLSPNENKQSYASWISFIHPDDLAHVMKVTKEAEETLSNASFYHRIVTRDGEIRNIHSRANYEFDTDGKPVGLFGVAHDITNDLANINRLKMQNEQLQDIAWIQSHKVRGPLATILGLTQQFGNSESEEETKLIIDGILGTSEKLDLVIREIVGKTFTTEISDPHNIVV